MNRSIIVLTGFLLISAGLMTAAYQTLFQKDMYAQEGILEKILEGEEYLQQTGDTSKSKAVSIFSELVAKNNPQYEFRIRYNLAKALENSGVRDPRDNMCYRCMGGPIIFGGVERKIQLTVSANGNI